MTDTAIPLSPWTRARELLPARLLRRLAACRDAARLIAAVREPRVLSSLVPSAFRGFVLRVGKERRTTTTPARHAARFDWGYPSDFPEMERLYERAKAAQWDARLALPWQTSVDPESPDAPLLPLDFFDFRGAERLGVTLTPREKLRLRTSLAAWTLSQFLHGEQGALYAAAQVVEALPFFDGKKYGATQVMDEARHVEAFQRYLATKLGQTYPVDDNLFVVIDALVGDRRWDVKFLGMQIMVEGLALSAFGSLYKRTAEPLLKELLRKVLEDEARHVQYGMLALKRHVRELSDAERREREDWAFEIALLMRDRFYAYEVYEEWFEAHLTRVEWRGLMDASPGMEEFRRVMYGRVTRNLREIGLLSPRVETRYVQAGLRRQLAAEDR